MINIVTCVNKKSGAGHISRMLNLQSYLKKKGYKSNLVLIDTNKLNKFIVLNKVKYTKYSKLRRNKNILNIIDLPIYYSATETNKKLIGKKIYFDRPKLKNSISQKIIKKGNEVILKNFFLSPPFKNHKKKINFLISGGGVIDMPKALINDIKVKKFSHFYIPPFLIKRNKLLLSRKSYLKYLSSSKCLITNYGISVFEALIAKIPVLISKCKKEDFNNVKLLNLKFINHFDLSKNFIAQYKKEIFKNSFYVKNNEITDLISLHDFSNN